MTKKQLGKKYILIIVVIMILVPSMAFGANTEDDEYEINSLNELKTELNVTDINSLNIEDRKNFIQKVDPYVATQFVDEKMESLIKQVNGMQIEGEAVKVINLGDNCTATITTTDQPENLVNIMSSTSGTKTLWKKYGKRQYTSKFEVRTGILDVDLVMINHYTLSAKGVALRYGESDVIKVKYNLDLGSASAGSVNEVKKTAYKKGESIKINSTFSYRWAPAYDVTFISKKFKMTSTVKFSDIDKTEKEVKVVQSWSGKYL